MSFLIQIRGIRLDLRVIRILGLLGLHREVLITCTKLVFDLGKNLFLKISIQMAYLF